MYVEKEMSRDYTRNKQSIISLEQNDQQFTEKQSS